MKRALKNLATGVALTVGLAMPAIAADPFNIGFLVPNVDGGTGWDHELHRGQLEAAEHFGDAVKFTYVDSVGEGPDATRMMNKLAATGADMIFLGSFGNMNDGLKLAKQYPNLAVVHAGGYLNSDNFSTYAARHYEGAYLAGMAAGNVTPGNKLGIIAAFQLPEVLGIMNAYVLGAQSVNSDITDVKVIWLNSWFDPAKNKAAAESLISQGTDVLFSLFPGTPAAVVAAEAKGVYSVTTLSDNSAFAPSKHLASIQISFAPFYVAKIEEAMAGKFVGNDTFWGLKEGVVSVVGLNADLSDAQRAAIQAKQDSMTDGSFSPFTGPITDNTGAIAVADGVTLDDGAIKGMGFIVQGIDTELSN